MSSYTNGPRYMRPTTVDRPGPRLNTPSNRNTHRPQTNKLPNMPQQQGPRPTKPANESSISTPSTSNFPAVGNPSTANSTDPFVDSSNKTIKTSSTENPSTEAAPYLSLQTSNMTINNQSTTKSDPHPSNEQQRTIGQGGQKRPRVETNAQQPNPTFDSNASSSQQQNNEKKITQGGRCRLFIGNIPSDLTQEEFQVLFGKYGELIEYFVNPSRGFGFVKLSSRQLAEQAKHDLDGHILRGKPLRIRFASQGATVKVKNLSPNVSNELLKEAFEEFFGGVERAVVIVDDRGKSTGEGIIEFEKKPSAQKCLNECTEHCFFITNELRPVIVEPWDIRDEEDGLPEKSLTRTSVYMKEREARPRFAAMNTIEHTIGLKWKELELQEKQLLEEVKRRMQHATEQVQAEIDRMYLEYQSQQLREELLRHEEDLRRIDQRRSEEIDRRRNMMPMHHPDAYNHPFNMPNVPINNSFQSNLNAPPNSLLYNDFQQMGYPNVSPLMPQASAVPVSTDAIYTTNQVARGYGTGGNIRDDFYPQQQAQQQQQQQQHGFDRKRPKY